MFPPVSRLDLQDLHLRSPTDLMRLIRGIPGYDMYLILRNITFLKPEQLQQVSFRRTPSQTAHDAVVYGCGDGSTRCQLSIAGAMLSSGLLAAGFDRSTWNFLLDTVLLYWPHSRSTNEANVTIREGTTQTYFSC